MLANIKIKTLIVCALSALMVLMLTVGALGLYGTAHTREMFKEVSLRDSQSENSFVQIRLLMETNRSQILQALQHNPAFDWSKLHDHPLDIHFTTIDKSSANIMQVWQQYRTSIVSPDEQRLADAWYEKSGGLGIKSVSDAALALKAGSWDEAESILIRKINPTYRVGTAASAELSEFLSNRQQANGVAVETSIKNAGYLLGGAMVISLGLMIATTLLLVRGITIPLNQAIAIAHRVAGGDLS